VTTPLGSFHPAANTVLDDTGEPPPPSIGPRGLPAGLDPNQIGPHGRERTLFHKESRTISGVCNKDSYPPCKFVISSSSNEEENN